MARHLLLVQTNPVEGREDEYNDWYDNVHLQEVLQVPGFVAAQRFVASATMAGREPPELRYLAIYEIETDDIDAALAALREGARSMTMTSALDRSTVQAFAVREWGPRQTREGTDA